ncbi:MAG: YdeI/OmpD-associated family protein [Bacteroidales bacterium]
MNALNPKVDSFLINAKKWQAEMNLLRSLILECNLTEEYKWMHPCYTFQGSNVVLIHGFKDYCALLFFKGVLLKDKKGILIQQTENVQDRRQIRFTSLSEIEKLHSTIIAYIDEAIEVEKSGLKHAFKKTAEFKMPDEFQHLLLENKKLKTAFEGLTPGRQRAYLLYFSSAKQTKTRIDRIEKYLQKILEGKGIED